VCSLLSDVEKFSLEGFRRFGGITTYNKHTVLGGRSQASRNSTSVLAIQLVACYNVLFTVADAQNGTGADVCDGCAAATCI